MLKKIAQFQQEKAVAFYTKKYHAQFQFTGRLTQPLTLLDTPQSLQQWAQLHKNGFVLVYGQKLPQNLLSDIYLYRAGELGFIESETLLAHFEQITAEIKP